MSDETKRFILGVAAATHLLGAFCLLSSVAVTAISSLPRQWIINDDTPSMFEQAQKEISNRTSEIGRHVNELGTLHTMSPENMKACYDQNKAGHYSGYFKDGEYVAVAGRSVANGVACYPETVSVNGDGNINQGTWNKAAHIYDRKAFVFEKTDSTKNATSERAEARVILFDTPPSISYLKNLSNATQLADITIHAPAHGDTRIIMDRDSGRFCTHETNTVTHIDWSDTNGGEQRLANNALLLQHQIFNTPAAFPR